MPDSTTCGQCRTDLSAVPAGRPCPKCRATARVYSNEVVEAVAGRDSVCWEHVHQFWEVHRVALALTVALTLGPPFLGLWLAGWPGVVVGLACSVVAALVGFRAATRVRETERG